jgi:hypothetical protein
MICRMRMPHVEPYRLIEMIGEADPTMTSPMRQRVASRAPRQVELGNRDGRGDGMARRATGRSGVGWARVPVPVPVRAKRVRAGPRSDER